MNRILQKQSFKENYKKAKNVADIASTKTFL